MERRVMWWCVVFVGDVCCAVLCGRGCGVMVSCDVVCDGVVL